MTPTHWTQAKRTTAGLRRAAQERPPRSPSPRIPQGHRVCGIDGCERILPREARSCYVHEDRGPDLEQLDRLCQEDEKHVHPLQLDVIERCLTLFSNPGETLLSPFMGVGSEVYAAVTNGRRGIGIELKPSYYRQALKNLALAESAKEDSDQGDLSFQSEEAALDLDESTPHRSDDWMRALGAQDAIKEELYGDPEAGA